MAESRRKTEGHKPLVEDDAQSRKDRLTLILFGIGAVVIIIGMWLLATFLSGN